MDKTTQETIDGLISSKRSKRLKIKAELKQMTEDLAKLRRNDRNRNRYESNISHAKDKIKEIERDIYELDALDFDSLNIIVEQIETLCEKRRALIRPALESELTMQARYGTTRYGY